MPRSWLRARGAQLARWIDDPNEPGCPIPLNSTTFDQLVHNAESFGRSQRQKSPDMESYLLLPPQSDPSQSQMGYYLWTMMFNEDVFVGITAPGVIALQAINRRIPTHSSPIETPHPSEIALSLYEHDIGGLESLRYVFALSIVNIQTQHLIVNDMCATWPMTTPEIWECGTQEYEQILGTRIGRTIGYLVLGGFPRGSRRIARVVVYCADGSLGIRFDIDTILNESQATQ